MIVIGCTEEDEARDMADILRSALPPEWEYQIFCGGKEFTTSEENPGRQRRRAFDQLLEQAGPSGIAARELRIRLNRSGQRVPVATVYRWLNEYRESGRVTHDGSKWALARQESTP